MKFVLASQNKHKAQEIKSILGEGFEILTQDEVLGKKVDVLEDGNTFEENAEKKAKTIMGMSGLPTIADDSGLCVDAIDGKPGVYTARFAGENATDDENISKLLGELKNTEWENRTARFVCVIALAIPNEKIRTFRGECSGFILTEKHGDNGFGYDPVFYTPKFDKSLAQITENEKNSISHRGEALKKLKEGL